MPKLQASEPEDKDLPLREDIRLLGRILGDTVREQGGEAVFDIVERIRQSSVRFRRDEDSGARRALETMLNSLAPTKALQIIRAFGFFSHLANIAEDQHHIRRTRAHALTTSGPREGSMAHALACAREAGIAPARLQDFFATAMVVPVLTAHPTEVRRKSTIDREMDVADLLEARDRQSLTTAELAANEAALRRAVLTLWQTSPLRRTRLRVIDEVTNGLSYYDYTFLKELPRFYAELEVELASEGMAPANWVSYWVLHCCSVDVGLLNVRLAPGSDRTTDNSAYPGCARTGHSSDAGLTAQNGRGQGARRNQQSTTDERANPI